MVKSSAPEWTSGRSRVGVHRLEADAEAADFGQSRVLGALADAADAAHVRLVEGDPVVADPQLRRSEMEADGARPVPPPAAARARPPRSGGVRRCSACGRRSGAAAACPRTRGRPSRSVARSRGGSPRSRWTSGRPLPGSAAPRARQVRRRPASRSPATERVVRAASVPHGPPRPGAGRTRRRRSRWRPPRARRPAGWARPPRRSR